MRCCRCPAEGSAGRSARTSPDRAASASTFSRWRSPPTATCSSREPIPDRRRLRAPGRTATTTGDQSPTNDRLGLIDPVSGRLLDEASLGAIYDISSLGWSRDTATVAVGTIDGTVETFDAHTLAVRHPPVVVTGGYVQSVDFSPDGAMLVVGGADGALSFWSADALTRLGPPITSEPTHPLAGGHGSPRPARSAG